MITINNFLPSKSEKIAGLLSAVKNIEKATEIYKIKSYLYSADKLPFILQNKNFIRNLENLDISADINHSHGLWKSPSLISSYFKEKNNIPNIISPHGMLDPWALNQSKFLKKVYFKFKEINYLSNCSCIHALCKSEKNAIKNLGIKNRVEIIPNAVDMPDLKLINNKNFSFFDKEESLIFKDYPYFLFLGRFHKKKGIFQLLNAWKKMQEKKLSNIYLVLAGFGDLKKIKNIIYKNDIRRVLLVGPCFGDKKNQLLSNCSSFVLPSLSEGLPMAVLEALSWGKLCLITKECNLDDAYNEGGAYKIDLREDLLFKNIEYWSNKIIKDPNEVYLNGMKGRELIAEKYTYRIVGQKLMNLYYSVLK